MAKPRTAATLERPLLRHRSGCQGTSENECSPTIQGGSENESQLTRRPSRDETERRLHSQATVQDFADSSEGFFLLRRTHVLARRPERRSPRVECSCQ